MFKYLLFLLIVFIIFFAALFGYIAFDIWHQNKYKKLVQTIELKDKDLKYMLFTDLAGFGDRAWYVYEVAFESGVTKKIKEAHNKDNAVFWNYSEAGNNVEEAKLKLINKKYLLFSRGNYYHSLYDIEKKQVLLNYESPWASFTESDLYKQSAENAENEKQMRLMDEWVFQNIHSKIHVLLKEQ